MELYYETLSGGIIFALTVFILAFFLGSPRIRSLFGGFSAETGLTIVWTIIILSVMFGQIYEEFFMAFGKLCVAISYSLVIICTNNLNRRPVKR